MKLNIKSFEKDDVQMIESNNKKEILKQRKVLFVLFYFLWNCGMTNNKLIRNVCIFSPTTGISVRFKGECNTKWTRGAGKSSVTYSADEEYFRTYIYVVGEKDGKLFCSLAPLCNDRHETRDITPTQPYQTHLALLKKPPLILL